MSAHQPLPVHVSPWVDAVVDAVGLDPRAPYVERFWLPVVGPSTVVFMRRMADLFEATPEGFEIDARMFARDIGVGTGNAGNPHLYRRTVERAERFGMLRTAGDDLWVRRKVAPLTAGQVARLPARHQRAHKQWQAARLARGTHPATTGHATRLAESLLHVGADDTEVREQLARWRFDDETVALAIEAAHRRTSEPVPRPQAS